MKTSRRHPSRWIAALVVLGTCGDLVAAGDVQDPARLRFAGGDTSEQPDFQRHVAPLLGRLGCNGRACHGSFQGQGGLQLSLFGYDFDADHAALSSVSDTTGQPRWDLEQPEQSLILRKPTLQEDHAGGQRFALDSWEYHLLRRWIEAGAEGVAEPRRLARLQVEPSELKLGPQVSSQSLTVTAVWEDGSAEDVTCLSRFRSNDEAVAAVDQNGRVTAAASGDTHVVVFYDNAVATVPVLRPFESVAGSEPVAESLWGDQAVDRLIAGRLRPLGLQPSELCTDAEYLRRLRIDLTGTLPTPDEVESFLDDPSPYKRTAKIDELLTGREYAAWWANKLADFTGCNPNQQAELGQEFALQWYMWLFHRVLENAPYDEIVAGIVLATSRRPDQTYESFAGEFSSYFHERDPADFSERGDMPHFWTRRTVQESEDKALAFSHAFLGLQLQCAQCHKHPWDRWTQQDFRQFAGFFDSIEYGVPEAERGIYREMAGRVGLRVRGDNGGPINREILARAEDGQTIPWRELYVAPRANDVQLQLLGQKSVAVLRNDDPRHTLMRWLREPDNPWFARALVNRVWANYFHRGLIEPTDDLNAANPPSNPELLDYLADGFIRHDFDLRWLHREITTSLAYQRSWRPNGSNLEDRRHFSRAVPRRIPAEVIYDALAQATAADDQQQQVREDVSRRAVGHLSTRMAGTYAMYVFGKPERNLNCDCERVNQPTLLQSIFLQNDPLVRSRLASSAWLNEIRDAERAGLVVEAEALIRQAWLRTLGRPPSAREVERAQQHVRQQDSLAEGLSDLLWALINTDEFGLNH